MNVLDENLRADQGDLLRRARIRHRWIGGEIGRTGTSDEDIIPILHRLKRPTLFTHDAGFFDPRHRHPNYCLVWLDVKPRLAALLVRRFLRHARFNPQAVRLGSVVAAHYSFLEVWRLHANQPEQIPWDVPFREMRPD